MPGYTGENCLTTCPYPYYGLDCQRECDCSRERCDVSSGCIDYSTSNSYYLHHFATLASYCLNKLNVKIILQLECFFLINRLLKSNFNDVVRPAVLHFLALIALILQ